MRSSVVVLVWSILLVACSRSDAAVGSAVVEGPADFQAVAEGAVSEARLTLPAVADCIQRLTIRPAWNLDDRGRYLDGVIEVRVPATAPRIEEVVVHELAHHLDATCDEFDDVREEFLVTQGSAPPWYSGPSWEETPAEQFAEAVTIVVFDRQRAHNVRVSPEAVEVVRRWGAATN